MNSVRLSGAIDVRINTRALVTSLYFPTFAANFLTRSTQNDKHNLS